MIQKKLRIRTLANEWYDDYSKINYDVYHMDYYKKSYDEIITFLKTKYKLKEKQIDSKATTFEFERRGFLMDVFVRKQATGKASVLTTVLCHFNNTSEGCYRVSINKLITNDTQTLIQKKFPEIFDNKTAYFVEVVELPMVKENEGIITYHDDGGITELEFYDKTEAIESARILAKELSRTSNKCYCITVIQGIMNSRKRYITESKYRRERDVYVIGTKSIPEMLLARRRYHYYPLIVDEYFCDSTNEIRDSKDTKHIYILTIALNDNRQFTMSTLKFGSLAEAQDAAHNMIKDWAESNQSQKYSFEKFEYIYKINEPNLIEVYSNEDKKRLTAMINEITIE